jgi:S-adenosyl methyltransferase
MRPRDHDLFAEIAFAGLDLVSPGVVLVSEWRRTDPSPPPPANEVNAYCGVAYKATVK